MRPDFSSGRRPEASWIERTWLVVGAVALVGSSVLAVRVRGQLAQVEVSVSELREDLARAQAAAPRPRDGAEARLAERARLVRAVPPGRIVEELAALLPDDVRLQALSVSYEGGAELALDVVAADATAYDSFLARLASAPQVAEVRPGPESRDGELRSRVLLVFKEGGP